MSKDLCFEDLCYNMYKFNNFNNFLSHRCKTSSCLCNDVLTIVYKYNKFDLSKTCKTFLDVYKKEKESIAKIIKWYNKYWPDSKLKLVNSYKFYYKWRFLKDYPTFLVQKCNKPHLLNEAIIAEATKSRSKIIKFLMLPDITKENIEDTGW